MQYSRSRLVMLLVGFLVLAHTAMPANAQSIEEKKASAESLVKKVVAAIKANGTQAVYADITAQKPEYRHGDEYADVYDLDGNNLAHGANPKLVGKNLSDLQDPDGVNIIKERATLAKTKSSFWYQYKYTNPVSKKIEPKDAYCETVEKTVVCAYAYK